MPLAMRALHQQEIPGGPRQEIRDGTVWACWLTASIETNSTHFPVSISQTVLFQTTMGEWNCWQMGQSL